VDEGSRRGTGDGQDTGVGSECNALVARREDGIIMRQAITLRQLAAASREEPRSTSRLHQHRLLRWR
jgi:hypothetical protein